MEKVEPIRNICDIDKIKSHLRGSNKRNYLLFVIGINTGMKSNKMLTLKFKDVMDHNYTIKEHIDLDGSIYFVNESINLAITDFGLKRKIDLDSYLFESQKSKVPINRSHLYKILNKTVHECGIDVHIGNETLRKTFGYHYYHKTGDVQYLKDIYNKTSKKAIFDYLCIESESLQIKEFQL
ncbi:tyrosine-type recombinase/integrase [Aquibacillus halophilus]|uniref:Tyrosine-type recombinase/integrase n=1 Tax=Aquibacillus halophilus TaxID=930132 RepID=A0A6A8D7K9_9BACI|nr:tyrosine-type recombinase/integrase [Aquibacillus halophilus]MRH41578.1 tyrosine-type recombinase/integrase [Aquibacillus halophilus]